MTEPIHEVWGDMPTWLVRRLDNAGYIDARMGASRKARSFQCPECKRGVLRGLDADMCARTAEADPTPLTTEGEALAVLMGAATYELRWLVDHYELDQRDQWRIKGRPAGKPGIEVLVEHRHPVLKLPRKAPQIVPKRPAGPGVGESAEECPF
jgi:hypothetical protein